MSDKAVIVHIHNAAIPINQYKGCHLIKKEGDLYLHIKTTNYDDVNILCGDKDPNEIIEQIHTHLERYNKAQEKTLVMDKMQQLISSLLENQSKVIGIPKEELVARFLPQIVEIFKALSVDGEMDPVKFQAAFEGLVNKETKEEKKEDEEEEDEKVVHFS